MVFKVLHKRLGAHIHVRLFQASTPEGTFAKNGDLVFDFASWLVFKVTMEKMGALVEPEPNSAEVQ